MKNFYVYIDHLDGTASMPEKFEGFDANDAMARAKCLYCGRALIERAVEIEEN